MLARRFRLRPLLLALLYSLSTIAVQATDRLVRLGYYDAKPSCFRDDAGQPAGIFIEVAKLVAARLSWRIEYRYGTWDELLDGLRTGTLDLVPAIVRTEARESFALFTKESVMTDWGAVYARRGQDRIGSILELEGRRVGALEEDYWFSGSGSLQDLCRAFGVTPGYRYYPDYSSLFHALGKGEIDAAVASNSLGIIWEPLLPIAATSVIYNPIELRFAASRAAPGAPALALALDSEIRSIRQEDPKALRDILGVWQVPTRKEYEAPRWLLWALGALFLVALALLIVAVVEVFALRRSNAQTVAALEKLRDASAALELSLGEKELLVHELSHRVKNNLQLVSSLLSLAASEGRSGDAATVLAEVGDKVFALALAEEEIHRSIAIGQDAVEGLVDSLVRRICAGKGVDPVSFSRRIDLACGKIDSSICAPLSIILGELVLNACMHGVDEEGRLEASITVAFGADGSGEIAVRDHGRGLPPDFGLEESGHLGLILVSALASQLGGHLETAQDKALGAAAGGAVFRVTIPAPDASS